MTKLFSVLACWIVFTSACSAQDQSKPGLPTELNNFQFQTGDVVGESELENDSSTVYFEAATGSRYGHVALVSVEDGKVYVYEEYPPYAQKNTIETFFSRAGYEPKTHHVLASILRPNSLTADQTAKILAAARQAVANQLPYNHDETMNDTSMNCSEFVHSVFAAADIKVGKVETVGDQNINAFNGLLIQMWEQNYGPLDRQAPVVSPMSVVLSDALTPVFANVPTDNYLSDHELFTEWDAEGFVQTLADQLGVAKSVLDGVGKSASTTVWRDLPPRGQRD